MFPHYALQVQRVAIDARAGIEHLAAMVMGLPLPPGAAPVPMTDDTLGDVLAQCQQRLAAAASLVASIPKAAALLEQVNANPDLAFSMPPTNL